jgi:hypothetical protein
MGGEEMRISLIISILWRILTSLYALFHQYLFLFSILERVPNMLKNENVMQRNRAGSLCLEHSIANARLTSQHHLLLNWVAEVATSLPCIQKEYNF